MFPAAGGYKAGKLLRIPFHGNSTSVPNGPTVRVADYTAKWKVIHWKSVNTTAFPLPIHISRRWRARTPLGSLSAI
jgi:hypothetical protein